ncbi:MAG: phosphoadenosine phosphosulfate reductase family protein [Eggerthellaceae bacterium]|nr:phosphoadenosine phosphosulfate reductase family protein [Eggerthellaceae bacterium]
MGEISYETMKQRQALPLEAKIAFTQSRIREWYSHWHGDVYVSFSGGKDSTALVDIVKGMYPDVPAVFCDTGLEYPEVRELAIRKADVVLKPEMTFKKVLENYGYPLPSKEQAYFIRQARHSAPRTRALRLGEGRYSVSSKWRFLLDAPFEISEKCCDVMKKKPFRKYERESGRRRMTAMMASESSLRERQYMRHGCNAFADKNPSSMPIAVWTEQDVLRYIVDNGIEYASCYGEIIEDANGHLHCTKEDRTGCMFCMFGIQYDGNPNRFQRMERDYPKQYDYCINKLGIGRVLDYVGIPYKYQETLFEVVHQ